MKAVNYLSLVAVAALTMTLTARAAGQQVANPSKESTTTGQLEFVTVQYGQGIAVTFVRPIVRRSAPERSVAARKASTTRWEQQSIPNGSPITYAVPGHKQFEVAPVK
jgi:hypothetical protein